MFKFVVKVIEVGIAAVGLLVIAIETDHSTLEVARDELIRSAYVLVAAPVSTVLPRSLRFIINNGTQVDIFCALRQNNTFALLIVFVDKELAVLYANTTIRLATIEDGQSGLCPVCDMTDVDASGYDGLFTSYVALVQAVACSKETFLLALWLESVQPQPAFPLAERPIVVTGSMVPLPDRGKM